MKYQAYELNHSSLDLNSCMVSAVSDASPYALVNDTIAVRLKSDNTVRTNHAVFHRWVLNTLRVKKTETVTLVPLLVNELDEGIAVSLQFERFISLKQWDDFSTDGPIYLPNVWYKTWPEGLNKEVVGKACNFLLIGTILCNGTMVAVRHLDAIFIFQVHIGIDSFAILGSRLCSYEVILNHNPCNSDRSGKNAKSTKPAFQKPTCFESMILNVLTLYEGIFYGDHGGAYAHSAIICAPPGGGKSNFLEACEDSIKKLNSNYSEAHQSTIIKVSCSSIGKICELDKFTDDSFVERAQQENSNNLTLHSLRMVLHLLIGQNETDDINFNDGVVLILDDLDCVLDQYSTTREDSVNLGEGTSPYTILGYYLEKLTSAVSVVPCPIRVLVIGATRRASTGLLRAHTGCPEFERSLELGSPTFDERCALLKYSLLSLGLPLSSLPPSLSQQGNMDENSSSDLIKCKHHENDSVDNEVKIISAWAEELAGLLAGYLPGDLQAVVQRIGLLHGGHSVVGYAKKASLTQSNLNQNITSSEVNVSTPTPTVQWSCALEAVLAIVPRQLQQLNSHPSGGSSGKSIGTQRLCWADFAGYSEIIEDLKRRLLVLNTSIQGRIKNDSLEKESESILRNDNIKVLQASLLRGVVIHGPTGCGKTLLANVIASELKMNIVCVKSTDLLSKYFGETENTIRNLFQKARAAAPCVLFFDDFDSLAHKRSAGDTADNSDTSNGLHGRILSTFLNELDGVVSGSTGGNKVGSVTGNYVLVVTACQNISSLDEALIRPGRLQHHVFLHAPRLEDISAILSRYVNKLNCSTDLNLNPAAASLYALGASASEVESFIRSIYTRAVREVISQIEEGETESATLQPTTRRIEQTHVDNCLEELLTQHGLCLDDLQINHPANEPIKLEQQPTFTWSGGFTNNFL